MKNLLYFLTAVENGRGDWTALPRTKMDALWTRGYVDRDEMGRNLCRLTPRGRRLLEFIRGD